MTCRCGHDRAPHLHYRRGTDCALCGPVACPRYRRDRWLAARLRAAHWTLTFVLNLVRDIGRRPRHP